MEVKLLPYFFFFPKILCISQVIPKQSCIYSKLDWKFPKGNDVYAGTHAGLQRRAALGSWQSAASFAGAERRASLCHTAQRTGSLGAATC